MPTPVAHSILAISMGILQTIPTKISLKQLCLEIWKKRFFFILCIILSLSPDVDYLFGLFYGNWNKFHSGATHSLIFVICTTVFVGFYLKKYKTSHDYKALSFGFIFLLQVSHLILDLFTQDTSYPIGIPLFWPVTYDTYHSPFEIFDAPAKRDFVEIFSWHNFTVLGKEFAMFLPLLIFVILFKLFFKKVRLEYE